MTAPAGDRLHTVDARLGMGLAQIGIPVHAGAVGDALTAVDRAWAMGIRTFDVAPFYAQGRSEVRAGLALARYPREEFTISTKVGRLPDGSFDFAADSIREQYARSLERLGMERVDCLYVHDPDAHFEWALDEAIPATLELRDAGAVAAVGVGMNQAPMLAEFVRRTGIDRVLVAGRYSLLDQSALCELLPLCHSHGRQVVVGGVFNSGVLADPRPTARYDYLPVPGPVLERVYRLRDVADDHGIPLAAAALQFPLGHGAVTQVLVGAADADEVAQDVRFFTTRIPDQFWQALRAAGLLAGDVPTPAGRPERMDSPIHNTYDK